MQTRDGFVLLLALLCILALEFTAAALHFAALHQVRAARAGARALQLDLSVQSAIELAVGAWPAGAALATPVGASFAIPAASGREDNYGIAQAAVAERLGEELFLVRAEARSPLREYARRGYLVRVSDPVSAVAAAALRAAGGVALDGGSMVTPVSAGCGGAGSSAAVQVSALEHLTVAPGARLQGDVDVNPEVRAGGLDALLPFPAARLIASATAIREARVEPAPVRVADRCVISHSANWGEPTPTAAGDPCASWYPVLSRTGSLLIAGGRGQGVLHVAGDLVLSAGALFSGLLLVDGSVTLEEGASVIGAVLVTGSATIRDATIYGDRCAVASALAAVPEVTGPFASRGRSWIPIF
ncbi:MAG: hypothetical protein FIB01_15270 [Gemmatimonadetes bacterium]|nr:hypothetical protein [Gemmatimonadota bacterium]